MYITWTEKKKVQNNKRCENQLFLSEAMDAEGSALLFNMNVFEII